MPRSTTRAGLAPRLFTPKITALPRTPYFIGVSAERGACKGIWIGRLFILGRAAALPLPLWADRPQQINITLCNVGRALQSAMAPVSRRSFRRGGDQCQEFGTRRAWA